MSTQMSAAQAAQQSNRSSDGKYGFGAHQEPVGLSLVVPPIQSPGTRLRALLKGSATLTEPAHVDFGFNAPDDFDPDSVQLICEDVADNFAFDVEQLDMEPDDVLVAETYALARKWGRWAGRRETTKTSAMGFHAAELHALAEQADGKAPSMSQAELHGQIMKNPGNTDLLQRSASMAVFYELNSGRHRPLTADEDVALREEISREGSVGAVIGRALFVSTEHPDQFGIKLAGLLIGRNQERTQREASFVPTASDIEKRLEVAYDDARDMDDYRFRLDEELPLLAGSRLVDEAVQSRISDGAQWGRRRIAGLAAYHHKLSVLQAVRPEVGPEQNANFKTQPICDIEVEIDTKILDGSIDESDYQQMVALNEKFEGLYDVTNVRNLVRHRTLQYRTDNDQV